MKGVSFARNKYLNRIRKISVDFCCFIDDDCIPQKNFILNHLKFITKEKCKIVTGPQIFKSKITFFRILERKFRQGDTIRWASTNNVFFKKLMIPGKSAWELDKLDRPEIDEGFYALTLQQSKEPLIPHIHAVEKGEWMWGVKKFFESEELLQHIESRTTQSIFSHLRLKIFLFVMMKIL